ncbi:hypothetical protein QBC45DRAFT_420510 [Copromyces sp. CBS 386.78]|nr:hypothetical protein QBC45DRAFT_420510 [Copromyces sp. CBS 386.78]
MFQRFKYLLLLFWWYMSKSAGILTLQQRLPVSELFRSSSLSLPFFLLSTTSSILHPIMGLVPISSSHASKAVVPQPHVLL